MTERCYSAHFCLCVCVYVDTWIQRDIDTERHRYRETYIQRDIDTERHRYRET